MIRHAENTDLSVILEIYAHARKFMEETLPFTIGGGIGQSRICMFFLRKAHIGEVQSSLWPEDVTKEALARGIQLL